MKYRYCTLLLMLACCSAAAHAQKSGKEITYLPAVEIRDGAVEKEAREVRLTMTVDLSEMRLRTQHTMALTPVLVSRDGSRENEMARAPARPAGRPPFRRLWWTVRRETMCICVPGASKAWSCRPITTVKRR